MTFKNTKNSKLVFSILVFSILFVGLKFLINKTDYCLTLIKFNMIHEQLDKLNLIERKKILFKIDKQNQNIQNYFRFTHEIIGTSSKYGKCKENVSFIINNFETLDGKETGFLIKNVDYVKKVNIKNILFLLFLIIILSSLKFFKYLIIFLKKEIRLQIHESKK